MDRLNGVRPYIPNCHFSSSVTSRQLGYDDQNHHSTAERALTCVSLQLRLCGAQERLQSICGAQKRLQSICGAQERLQSICGA